MSTARIRGIGRTAAAWFVGGWLFAAVIGACASVYYEHGEADRRADEFWAHELPGRSVELGTVGRTTVATWTDERGTCTAEVVWGGDSISNEQYPVALRDVRCSE